MSIVTLEWAIFSSKKKTVNRLFFFFCFCKCSNQILPTAILVGPGVHAFCYCVLVLTVAFSRVHKSHKPLLLVVGDLLFSIIHMIPLVPFGLEWCEAILVNIIGVIVVI